ncbi:hypothetical protein BDV19DRAFT_388962 [Aspergillus venezuelensis]
MLAIETAGALVPMMKRVFETSPAPNSPRRYAHYEPLNSKSIYKFRKYYISHLRLLLPPSEISNAWDCEVSTRLSEHLLAITRVLPEELRDEETFTEPVLCMAGMECKPQDVDRNVMVGNSTEPVAVLQPTVWISCGSRKCRRKVKASLPRAVFLHSFLRDFDMGEALVTLEAPKPAADHQIAPNLRRLAISFDLERTDWHSRFCESKARFTIDLRGNYISTIGGVIMVDNVLYGLTSAHGIVSGISEATARQNYRSQFKIETFASESDFEYS